MKRQFGFWLLSAFAVPWLTSSPAPAEQPQVQVFHEVQHGISAPLRSLALHPPAVATPPVDLEEDEERPLHSAPAMEQDDPVWQQTVSGRLPTTPGLNLVGLGGGFTGPQGIFSYGFPPPDPNGSVGATQVLETVNLDIAVFNKTSGAVTLGPVKIATLWNDFSVSECSGAYLADPIVLYDKQAGRWLIKIVTITNSPNYYTCFAVSTTSDATGKFYLYAFEQPGQGITTGQKLGVWPDAYYMSQWVFSTTYTGPQACALDRTSMLAGRTATMQCFQITDPSIFGMLPSDLDGATLPPTGSPNYFLIQGPAKSNSLYMFQFHVDFTTPSNSTFTGPATISVAPYASALADGTVSIPQPGTSNLLDANGSDLMPRLAYRNFPSATPPHESLVVTHSILVGTGSKARVGTRWYELRSPGATPVVYQEGTYSPDTTYRWMGSIAMDKVGNIALGYTASSSTIYPSMRYTGRLSTDKLNSMAPEATIMAGSGAQMVSGRWGDYTSMSVDPADDCIMWHIGEYMAGTGTLEWATKLFQFKFSSCK